MRYLQVYENFFSPDDIEIRWGREKREADYTIKNVIVSYRGKDITGQRPITGNADEDIGSWNEHGGKGQVVVWVPDKGEVAYIPTMYLPEEFQGKGIAREVFRKVSKALGRRIRNDQEIGLGDQSLAGKLFWLKKQEFRPDGTVQKKVVNNLKEIILELVDEIPDSDMPSKTNVIKKIGDYIIYTEGWCDRCFSNYEELSRDEMVEKAKKLTPERLKQVPYLPQYKEMFRGKNHLKKWYFFPLSGNSVNYCLSVGVFL